MLKNQTFRRVERIKKDSDFTEILRKGKKFKTEEVVIFILQNQLPYSRLGISISKQLKGAVVRNKLKRLAREVFRKNKSALKGSYDIVVLFRDSIGYKKLENYFIKIMCNA